MLLWPYRQDRASGLFSVDRQVPREHGRVYQLPLAEGSKPDPQREHTTRLLIEEVQSRQ